MTNYVIFVKITLNSQKITLFWYILDFLIFYSLVIKKNIFYSLFSFKKVLENKVIKVILLKINPRCERGLIFITLLLGNIFENKVILMAYKVIFTDLCSCVVYNTCIHDNEDYDSYQTHICRISN